MFLRRVEANSGFLMSAVDIESGTFLQKSMQYHHLVVPFLLTKVSNQVKR